MPRVTDFPDQSQSMLSAVLQNRALNLQSDQQYLEVAAQSEAAQQSMLGMVMGDTLARDQMAQNKELTEDEMALRDKIATNNNLLGYAQLGETKRSNIANEDLTAKNIQLAREELEFTIDTTKDNFALNALNKFESDFKGLQGSIAQRNAYLSKLQKGQQLTGAEMSDLNTIDQQIRVQAALGHDIINEIGKRSDLSEATLGLLQGAYKPVIENMSSVDYEALNNRNIEQGLANSVEPPAIQKSKEYGVIKGLFRGVLDDIERVFTSDDNIPSQTENLVSSYQDIIDGKAEWSGTTEKRFNETLHRFYDSGIKTDIGIFSDDDAIDANKNKHLGYINEKVIEGAVIAKMHDEARKLELEGEEFDNYVSNPYVQSKVREEILPVEIKQGENDMATLERLQRLQTDLGMQNYMQAVNGNPDMSTIAKMQSHGFGLNLTAQLDQVKANIDSGNSAFLDPAQAKHAKNMMINLTGFGTLRGED